MLTQPGGWTRGHQKSPHPGWKAPRLGGGKSAGVEAASRGGGCVGNREGVRDPGVADTSASQPSAGRELGRGRRVPARRPGRRWRRDAKPGGHFLAAPLAEPGLLALGCHRRASRPTAGRAGGETRSPVRIRVAERAPRARTSSARGAGLGGPGALGAGRGGDSGARATLASYAYKSGVAEEGRRGPARGRLSSPKELTFRRTRATSRRRRSPGPRRREEGAEEGGDCGAWPRKAHILGRAAVTRRGLTLHE